MIAICEHFGFSAIPFLKAPKKPFSNARFAENTELVSTAFHTRQMVVVTGASGSGKSSFMRYAADRTDPSSHRIVSCEIANPSKKGLYRSLAAQCGVHPNFFADDVKMQLMEFFEDENRQGRLNCIILDEVHSLSIPMLAEIRSFYEEAGNFSLILVGLPNFFTEKLDLTVNLPLKRRISIVIHLESITLSETRDYVQHHLDAVKAKNQIFDEKCFPALHSMANGLPGRIDQLCAAAIFQTFRNKTAIVDEDTLRTCAQSMHY